MKHLLLTLAALPLVLAGCATPPPPPAQAVTSFQPSSACTATITLAAITSLTPEAPTGQLNRAVDLTSASPCYIGQDGQARPYAVFSLPAGNNTASILAGASIETARTVAPTVDILSADMVVRRSFSTADFTHRGRTNGVLFRPHAGDAYIVISADPARIGGAWDNYTYDPNFPPSGGSLMDVADDGLAFSYEGLVFVRVYFSDPADAASAD